MNDKLNVVVRVDLDCASMCIQVCGRVTGRNVQVLYVLARRANSLIPGSDLLIDVSGTRIQPAALEQLRISEETRRLPVEIDPLQADCSLRILTEPETGHGRSTVGLAA